MVRTVRMEGHGNGGNDLELTKESIDEILTNNYMANPKYVGVKGLLMSRSMTQ